MLILAVVLALTVGGHVVIFLLGTACFAVIALIFWQSYLKSSGGVLSDRVHWTACHAGKYAAAQFFFIVLTGSALYWLAYYPGGFNLDAYGQWMQAHGELPYSDWHPIFSTLLIQLAVSVVDRFEFYILIQLLLFSLSAALLLNALEASGVDHRALLCVACFIGLNPAVGLNSICMTKDVQFTILTLLLTACFIRIVATRGDWLNRASNLIYLGLLCAFTLLVRHNGSLFVVPGVLILLLTYKSKALKIGFVCLLAVTILLIVKLPVSRALAVEPHENVVGEAVGIPMGIMVNALVNDPENIPEDVHAFLNEIASDSEWESHYFVGEWDSCKWEFGGPELLKGVSLTQILCYTWKTVLACPQAAYESFRVNTQIVWEPFRTNPDWIPEDYIAPNDVGITHAPVSTIQTIMKAVQAVSMFPVLSCVFWNTGFHIAVILLAFCLCHRRIETEKTLLFLPLLVYDLGTMLLLAGPNQRYFYCNAVLYLPVTLFLLTGPLKKEAAS